jgi:predicted DNA-binding protein (MmcQ/YjbR family)
MTPEETRWALREYALSLPEAYEDFPWGERAIKVRKKVLLFLSSDDYRPVNVGLKLVESHALGLAQPGVEPMDYGLGRHGWVYVRLSDETPFEMVRQWIDESYRAVAPRALARQLSEIARAG